MNIKPGDEILWNIGIEGDVCPFSLSDPHRGLVVGVKGDVVKVKWIDLNIREFWILKEDVIKVFPSKNRLILKRLGYESN